MSVYSRFSASPLDRLFNIFTKQDVRLHIERKKVSKKSFYTTAVKKKLVSSTSYNVLTTFKKTSSNLILKCKVFSGTILQNILKYNRHFRFFPLRKFILFNHVPELFKWQRRELLEPFGCLWGEMTDKRAFSLPSQIPREYPW